jgi:hypothetical protein
MTCCKLTDKHDQTRNETQWGEGISHETSGVGALCGPGWLHYYDDPLLAVLLNPLHGNFDPETMHLWECLPGGTIREDRGLKFACTKLKTLVQITVPQISTRQRVAFGVLCASKVYKKWEKLDKDKTWHYWATEWLFNPTGIDIFTAIGAYNSASNAAHILNNNASCVTSTAYGTYDACISATNAAHAAIYSNGYTGVYAAAHAADRVARTSTINLKSIAKKAMEF